jgi:branched-chain amino acid transport system permease protein
MAGIVVAGVLAALIGYPILKLQGDYLAICTLGFGEIIKVCIQNIEYLGGARGISAIPSKTNFTTVFICLVICFAVIKNLVRNSSKGRAILSVKEDSIAAEAMGVDTTKYKMIAFVIGCGMAGLSGGLYAHFNSYIDPPTFNFSYSFTIMTYVVLGGMGSLSGTILGTFILIILPELLRSLSPVMKDYRMLIYAILLITMMLFRPQGIMGTREITWNGAIHFFKSLPMRFVKKKSTGKVVG